MIRIKDSSWYVSKSGVIAAVRRMIGYGIQDSSDHDHRVKVSREWLQKLKDEGLGIDALEFFAINRAVDLNRALEKDYLNSIELVSRRSEKGVDNFFDEVGELNIKLEELDKTIETITEYVCYSQGLIKKTSYKQPDTVTLTSFKHR